MRAGLWGRLGVVTDPNVGGGSYLTMGDQYMVIFLSLFTVLTAVTCSAFLAKETLWDFSLVPLQEIGSGQ